MGANNPEIKHKAGKLLLVLDYGGTKHTVALLKFPGKASPNHKLPENGWQAHQRVYSPPGADANYDIETTFQLAHELLKGQKPAAIGVSFGGPVNPVTGTVRLSHHVPGWENMALGERLESEFEAPVFIDKDTNAAAMGEYKFGAGIGCHSMMFITVSTGVGGGWILNGKPWHGADSMAGEIGHTVADPQGPTCLCGKRGCVERLASGPYMAADARQALEAAISKQGSTDQIPKLPMEHGGGLLDLAAGDLTKITGDLISRAATGGDQLAGGILDRAAWALGVGIGNAANLVNPGRFIIGGGVTKSGQRFWDLIRKTARETALPEVSFRILPAALGDDAPLWGAAARVLERMEF